MIFFSSSVILSLAIFRCMFGQVDAINYESKTAVKNLYIYEKTTNNTIHQCLEKCHVILSLEKKIKVVKRIAFTQIYAFQCLRKKINKNNPLSEKKQRKNKPLDNEMNKNE